MARPPLSQGLRQSSEQRLELAPRILQSIELLALPALELEAWLARAAEENEALELGPRAGEEGPPPPRGGARQATERHSEWLESQPGPVAGLLEHVSEEIALLALDPESERWVRLVVSALDERGWLSADQEELLELARESGLEPDPLALASALETVRGLEPRGLGARDAIDALRLQLDPSDPEHPLLARLVDEFLLELARNRRPAVARALGVDLERLEELVAKLALLASCSAAGPWGGVAPALAPDLVADIGAGGSLELRQDARAIPPVSIDPRIESLAADPRQAGEVRRYLREKLERARWIVQALEQRGRTLIRVATAALERQHEFLRRGPGHLVPLAMTDLAGELGLAPSTISRAVAGKHVQTPWGIVPLRELFQASGGAGQGASCDELREAVRRAVEGEDARRPLSDEELVDALRRRGLEASRRSVARYRRELGIPSSYRRRRYSQAG